MAQDQGFASMDKAKQKDISSDGGNTTKDKNLTTEARSKGGKASHGGGRKS